MCESKAGSSSCVESEGVHGIEGLKAELASLKAARTGLEFRIGQALRLFRDRRFDTMEVGRRDLSQLARRDLGIGRTEAYDLARLAEGLESFPLLRGACRRQELSRSHLLLLLRVVERETEAGWVRLARGLGVADLRRVVRAWLRRERGEHPDDDDPCFVTVYVQGSPCAGHALRIEARDSVEKAYGHEVPMWRVLEAVAAEFMSGWPEYLPNQPFWDRGWPQRPGTSRHPVDREEVELPSREELERQTSGRGGEAGEDGEGGEDGDDGAWLAGLPDPADALCADDLLETLVRLVGLRNGLDWRTGRALDACRRRLVRVDPERDLGISARKAREIVGLNRRLAALPALRDAWREGRLGAAKTWLLIRVCTAGTAGAWLERARVTTLRGMKRQVDAMARIRDLEPGRWAEQGGLPPDEALLRELGIEPGGFRYAVADIRTESERALRDLRAGLGPGWGRANTFRAPVEVASLFFTALEGARRLLRDTKQRRMPHQSDCALFLVQHFLEVRAVEEGATLRGKRFEVLRRDEGHCAFPDCDRRGGHGHHLLYQSRGGGDDPGNVATVCVGHHLGGEHEGKVRIRGRAPGWLTFRAGRRLWRGETLVEGRPAL